jgi:hypothetical protein
MKLKKQMKRVYFGSGYLKMRVKKGIATIVLK